MRVADLAILGILLGGAAVGGLFLMARSELQNTDWNALPAPEAYARLCSTCHGPDGTAPTGTANSFKGKRRYWDVPRLVEYVANPIAYAKAKTEGRLGQRFMQPIPAHVPMETRERLAKFVLDELMD
ncbi:MAG: cytochrome c [Planctomycetota bacterium]